MSREENAPLPLEATWTQAEQEKLQRRLLPLLARRMELYAAGDTSVRVETAQALLASIVYTLEEGLSGAPQKTLLTADLNAVFERGSRAIDEKVEAGHTLWSAACLSAPKLDSRSLHDTLTGIENFWKNYDARFFAQEIPCMIDYPLLCPVPERLLGIAYIDEYLRRLCAENAVLAAFSPSSVAHLLDADCALWRDAPVNLAAGAFANAVGLALLGKDPRTPALSDGELAALGGSFALYTDAQAAEALRLASGSVCDKVKIQDAPARDYFADAAAVLLLRLRAVPVSGWRGIFPAP